MFLGMSVSLHDDNQRKVQQFLGFVAGQFVTSNLNLTEQTLCIAHVSSPNPLKVPPSLILHGHFLMLCMDHRTSHGYYSLVTQLKKLQFFVDGLL